MANSCAFVNSHVCLKNNVKVRREAKLETKKYAVFVKENNSAIQKQKRKIPANNPVTEEAYKKLTRYCY